MTLIERNNIILQDVKFGSSVAELDTILTEVFIRTTTLSDFVQDRYDIIRGAKGTGKSALLLYIIENHSQFGLLNDVTLIKATAHTGEPGFQLAFRKIEDTVSDDVYVEAWKVYFINLVWPIIEDTLDNIDHIKNYLLKKGILAKEPGLLFQLKYAILRAKLTVGVDAQEYGLQLGDIPESERCVDYNYIFESINALLRDNGIRYWVLFDRLDDAFPNWDMRSTKAMRGLLSMHKDMLGFENMKMKTFVRTDIYDRLTMDHGFRSLSHLSAKTSPTIIWDESQIQQFIEKRLACIQDMPKSNIIEAVFGDKIDVGPKQPSSFRWLQNHLQDGNGLITPRDILYFLDAARMRTKGEIVSNSAKYSDNRVFTRSAMKKAWEDVSKEKLETQIYAENPELRT